VLLSEPGVARTIFAEFGTVRLAGRGSFDDGLARRWRDKGGGGQEKRSDVRLFLFRGDIVRMISPYPLVMSDATIQRSRFCDCVKERIAPHLESSRAAIA